MTLTSDLVLRIIVSRACLLYSLSEGFQILCVDASFEIGVMYHFWVTVTLTSDLVLE